MALGKLRKLSLISHWRVTECWHNLNTLQACLNGPQNICVLHQWNKFSNVDLTKHGEPISIFRMQTEKSLKLFSVSQYYFVGTFLIAIGFFSNANARDYDEFIPCDQYEEFLADGGEPYDSKGCDRVTAFLLDNSELDRVRFILEYEKYTTKGSSFQVLNSALIRLIHGDAAGTYRTLEIAGPMIYHAFERYDGERTILYSYLISKVREQALRALFSGQSSIDSLFLSPPNSALRSRPYMSFVELEVSVKRPDIALMCLIRSDNLAVDIEMVTSSKIFSRCLDVSK